MHRLAPPPRPSYLCQEREVQKIILNAKADAASKAEEAERRAEGERVAAEAARKKEKEKECKRKKLTPGEKEVNKEKRLTKLVGTIVVKSMSKYAKGIDKEDFKKHVKEVSWTWVSDDAELDVLTQLTHLIVEKEKKSSSYKENRLEALSDEKVSKIKRFSREYIAKLVRKLEKAGVSRKPGSKLSSSRRGHHAAHTPSTSAATPSSVHEDAQLDVMEMLAEEVMNMDDDVDDDDQGQNNGATKLKPYPLPIAPTSPSPVNRAWDQGGTSQDDGFGSSVSLELPSSRPQGGHILNTPPWLS